MSTRKVHWIGILVPFYALGCYNPSPPAGSYLCATADDSCPSGQHCTCGLCVSQDSQSACSFDVTTSTKAVSEHQQFTLNVNALAADGMTQANGFNGTVSLSSSWGDIRPTTVTLVNGKATIQASLNRETLPPQTAIISATFAGNKGASGKIAVTAPTLVRDLAAIVPPASAATPYVFADVLVAQPDLVRAGSSWRMYFGGYSGARSTYSFGLATSSDGVNFTPNVMPIFDSGTAAFDKGLIESPSAFTTCSGTSLVFESQRAAVLPSDTVPGEIGLASSSDGTTSFTLAQSTPILTENDCGYCGKGLQFPSVIHDPASASRDGGACNNNFIMFFSALSGMNSSEVNIGRAESSDGVHFTAEPAPLLSGDLTGEAVLLSPRVIVDGTVYKMFYSFARLMDFHTDVCGSNVGIGYATSSDGFYWIRSPSNPVMQQDPTEGGWDAATTAFLVGSVVPKDGVDPQNGLSLYYSTFRHLTISGSDQCLPNGIGRATRP
jgi:hypothetical protein